MKIDDLKQNAKNLFDIMIENAYKSGYIQGQIDLANAEIKEMQIKIKLDKEK